MSHPRLARQVMTDMVRETCDKIIVRYPDVDSLLILTEVLEGARTRISEQYHQEDFSRKTSSNAIQEAYERSGK